MRIFWLMMTTLIATACATPPAASVDRIVAPLTSTPGDVARGRQILIAREGGHCILCHHVPVDEIKVFGNVGPPLDGVGSRLDAAQLRQRVVDISAVNPQAVMPSFHRVAKLQRVADEYRDKPVLDAQQVEDVVAYLVTLKN